MYVKILNLDNLVKKLTELQDLDLRKPLREGTLLVSNTAKDFAPINKLPVKTKGRLKRGVQFRPLNGRNYKDGGVVYNNVYYAVYQEFGTRFMKAQPFMRPALKQNESKIKEKIVKEVRDKLSKVSNV